MIVEVLWGSVLLPLLVSVVMFAGGFFSGREALKALAVGVLPAAAFVSAWGALSGFPSWQAMTGNDWLLVATPVLALLWPMGFRYARLGWVWQLIAGLFIAVLLAPLEVSGRMLLILLMCYGVWVSFLERHKGARQRGERPLELLLSLIAGLSLLAWLMLVWGSASQAQIVGGFCTALGFLSLLVVLSLADLKGDLLGWVGPWFGWLALFAYYYLEIPWWVLLLNGMVFVSGYYGSSAGYMKPWSWKALGLRIVLLAILVGGLGFLALQVKPKSFY
ncbi:MAG: hypothetical protein H6624_03465 [Bdellovibrionaceae bacterium]|nr:hypothetical protein [Bdellovibrionales bacterium]MCB9083373.1 hypothetical protein [Pseudobdellovibrionaceae bacterium]